MSSINLKSLIAIAAIGASSGFGNSVNTAYAKQKEKQIKEHDNALSKKQRVREQIRERRKALK